ncbi:MAG TPA: ATP-binding protein [Solirubrobacteraceae bacterium]|nr:ATP-binding protein [Solirubrobacteraceae bacterium]
MRDVIDDEHSPLDELIDERDWASTPIGPTETWPQSLRTALSICLESRFPILIWWGPEFVMLYNEPYAQLLGNKHPTALGQRGVDCFPEIWDLIGPMLAGVRDRGEATWSPDQLVELDRSGFVEECYFTFGFSPIRDETGGIGGIFTAVAETTGHVIGARRLQILRQLTSATSAARTPAEACERAAAVFRGSIAISFSIAYLFDDDRTVARLVATSDLKRRLTSIAPRLVDLTDDDAGPWPLASIAGADAPMVIEDIVEHVGDHAATEGLPRRALLLPLQQGTEAPVGALVLGVNERRPVDDDYVAFLKLVARQVGAAIADARRAEAERQRSEALAELDRAKTLFFTNVSHELRTPLTLILSPLEELLAEAEQPAGRRDDLELIRRNALRLLRLVNTLLDFSRAESGRIDALFQPTDLAAVTADLASAFRSAIEAAGLRLAVDCPPLGEPIWVDREAWEKIVLNLVSNALKFTFAGEIAISLHLEEDDVVLRVHDTGVGVPAEELPRLFERFHRIKDAAARSHEGSGIGLALIDELTRLHGGAAVVASEVGTGSTFTVRLPRGNAHLPVDKLGGPEGTAARSLGAAPYVEEALRWLPDETRPEPAGGAELLRDDLVRESGAPRTTNARILIADDNADMRGYLARLLRRYWQVETAADGEAALAHARQSPPDLVLSDVMMPRLDGFELLRELRADARTSNIPVVLVSARAGAESAIEGLEAGADDYLVKPFSARELVARVRANLELARLRVETAQLEAIAAERARAERVLMTLPEGVFTVDSAGAIDLWNPAAAHITGLPAEAVVGSRVDETLPGWHAFAPRLNLRNGKPRTYPFELDGREIWLSLVATPYADGTLYAFRDATETARLEQMRRDVITTVSHELRTPVTSIYGAAATLARSDAPLTESTREQLIGMLRAETERLSRIVNDLLTANSLAGDDTRPPAGECDLEALVERVLERAKKRCPDNLQLRKRLPRGTDPAALDEERLEQILDALLDNAIRYSPDGGEIELAVERADETIRFSVRDTGIGIDARHHPHIGEKFYRADPEQQTGAAGLGLGLYICNQLASLMNGRLWFESTTGAGSTFFLELPEPTPARSHEGRTTTPHLATRA